MKNIILLILMSSSICFAQESKIPEKYSIEVTYISGAKDLISLKNDEAKPNIPKPIVKDKSVFYNGEYVLDKVKSIKILNTSYYQNNKTDSEIKITKLTYYDPWVGKERKINVISNPSWEASQRQAEAETRKTSIFGSDNLSTEDSQAQIPTDTLRKDMKPIKEVEVYSRTQGVYESDGNGNFQRLENTGLKLNGNYVEKKINSNFKIKKVTNSENVELSKLNLKKGVYIIERELDVNNKVISYRRVLINLNANDE
jgi:hypothetical protein